MTLHLDAETIGELGYAHVEWFVFALYGEQLRRRQMELKSDYNKSLHGRKKHAQANEAHRQRVRAKDPAKLKEQQRKWWRAAQERKNAARIAAGLPPIKSRKRRSA